MIKKNQRNQAKGVCWWPTNAKRAQSSSAIILQLPGSERYLGVFPVAHGMSFDNLDARDDVKKKEIRESDR